MRRSFPDYPLFVTVDVIANGSNPSPPNNVSTTSTLDSPPSASAYYVQNFSYYVLCSTFDDCTEVGTYSDGIDFQDSAENTLRLEFDDDNLGFSVYSASIKTPAKENGNNDDVAKVFLISTQQFVSAVIIGGGAILSFFALLHRKYGDRADDANWMQCFFYALQVWDFISDLIFIISLGTKYTDEKTGASLSMLLLGIAFLVIPYLANIVSLSFFLFFCSSLGLYKTLYAESPYDDS